MKPKAQLPLMICAGAVVLIALTWEKPSMSETIAAEYIHVIDGDTIAVGDTRYRLTGFDTPEISNAKCEGEKSWGESARWRLNELITLNNGLTLKVEPNPDKYGRKLAEATAGSTSVRDVMLREGLARPYDGGKREGWCDEF